MAVEVRPGVWESRAGDLRPSGQGGGGGGGNEQEDILEALRRGLITPAQATQRLAAIFRARGTDPARASQIAANVVASEGDTRNLPSQPPSGGQAAPAGGDLSDRPFPPGAAGPTMGSGAAGSILNALPGDPTGALDPLNPQESFDLEDVFRQFVAGSPFALNPLVRESAGRNQENAIAQFFLSGMPDPANTTGQVNAFREFLNAGRGFTGNALRDQLGFVADLLGRDQASLSDPRSVNLFGAFSDPNQQLAAARLPFTQGRNPYAAGASSRVLQNVFDRFISQNPTGNFLDYLQDRNFGGMFG